MTRHVTHRYQDPLEVIWIYAARQAGIQVERNAEVNASWDGSHRLRFGTTELLDADDNLAQMILHEMCHALVAGPDGFVREDWGLIYDEPDHIQFEHAALRLQAALADPYGLRQFLASTTDHREYFDRLPKSPLDADDDPAVDLARRGMQLAIQNGWLEIIETALSATQVIAKTVSGKSDADSLWTTTDQVFPAG